MSNSDEESKSETVAVTQAPQVRKIPVQVTTVLTTAHESSTQPETTTVSEAEDELSWLIT